MSGQKATTGCKQLIQMNPITNAGSWTIAKGQRRPKYGRALAGRQFAAGQNDEALSRALRQKIELAVDECCVWPNQNLKKGC
jgi:hypothetical protein